MGRITSKFKDIRMKERGVAILLENGFLEDASHVCLKIWQHIDAETKLSKEDDAIEKFEKYFNDREEYWKCLLPFTREISSLLRLSLYSRYRSILLEDQTWLLDYLSQFCELKCFQRPYWNPRKSFNNELRSTFNQHFMVLDFVSRIDFEMIEKNRIFFEKQVTDLFDSNFRHRIIGVEIVTDTNMIAFQHFELTNYHVNNIPKVSGLSEHIVYQVDPNAMGQRRQISLLKSLVNVAEKFIQQQNSCFQNVVVAKSIFYFLQWILILIMNVLLISSTSYVKDCVSKYNINCLRIGLNMSLNVIHTIIAYLHFFSFFDVLFFFDYTHPKKENMKDPYSKNYLNICNKINKNMELCCGEKWGQKILRGLRTFCQTDMIFQLIYVILSTGSFVNPVLLPVALVIALLATEKGKELGCCILNEIYRLTSVILLGISLVYIFATIAFALRPGEFSFHGSPFFFNSYLKSVLGFVSRGIIEAPIFCEPNTKCTRQEDWILPEESNIHNILFVFFYNIFVVLIFTAIFVGIVIEAFADQRDALAVQEDALDDRCFVCGAKRDYLGRNFDHHVTIRHPLRSYLNLVAYVLGKKDDFSLSSDEGKKFETVAIMKMLTKKVLSGKPSFFPSYPLQLDRVTERLVNLQVAGLKRQVAEEWYEDIMWDIADPPRRRVVAKKKKERDESTPSIVSPEITVSLDSIVNQFKKLGNLDEKIFNGDIQYEVKNLYHRLIKQGKERNEIIMG